MTTDYIKESSDEDIRRNFTGSWIFMLVGTVYVPIYIQDFRDNQFYYTTYPEKEPIKTIGKNDKRLDTDLPDLGMFEHQSKLFYATRIPARQWNRGFRPKYISLRRLEENGSFKVDVTTPRLISLLSFAKNKTHSTKVLNRDWGIYKNKLYLRSIMVGICVKNKVKALGGLFMLPDGYEFHK